RFKAENGLIPRVRAAERRFKANPRHNPRNNSPIEPSSLCVGCAKILRAAYDCLRDAESNPPL
ncbi:MAG: hypothetical protein K0R75_3574, partial [Paenibacillaceae bacterium]|nr:hypothetical protein [Paenibacillaceae bacterium]